MSVEEKLKRQADFDQFVAKAGEGGLTDKEKKDIQDRARKLKDVHVNLAYARMAVGHIKSTIGLVANWDQHLDTSVEKMARNLRAQRPGGQLTDADSRRLLAAEDAADRCVYRTVRENPDHPGGIHSLDDIMVLADLSERNKCGNCMELAARTFMFLYRQGLRPLDYMLVEPRHVDHAFVVLGRTVDAADWTKWNKEAVVCDPWAAGLLKPKSYDPKGGAYGDFYSAIEATFLGFSMRQMFPSFTGVVLVHSET